MTREQLIAEVKQNYDDLANANKTPHFIENDLSGADKYFENTLNTVIHKIQNGDFDNCKNGNEIVEKIANNPALLQ